MALVVQPHGKTELLGGGREAPDALGLVAFLAAKCQRQPDDKCIDPLCTRDAFDLREILDHASPDERPERSRKTMRVIAYGEADTAIADVERQISHPLGRARCRRQRLDEDRDPRVQNGKTRPPLRPWRDAPKPEPELFCERPDRLVLTPGEGCGHLRRIRLPLLLALRANAPVHAVVLDGRADHLVHY